MIEEAGNHNPLSPNQEDLWRSHYLSQNQNHLNMFSAWILPEDANIRVLKDAFQGVMDQYETLRTNYKLVDGEPIQYIHPEKTLDFKFYDFSLLSKEEFDRRLADEAHEPFELERGAVIKIRIYQNSCNQKILLFIVHHLAIDGWSIMVMMKEFGRMYDELLSGENPKIHASTGYYAAFAREQRQKNRDVKSEKERRYWSERLINGEGIQPVSLQAKNSLPHSFNGESSFLVIDKILKNKLLEVAKTNNTTLYTVLLTGFKLLLHRYSNQKHIWIATPVSRRNTKILNHVGFYANTLYIHGDFEEHDVFADLLKQISETLQESIENQNISFSQLTKLMQENGLHDAQSHTNVMFSFQNMRSITKNNLGAAFLGMGGAKGKLGSLEIEVYPLKRSITQFEIELEGVEYNKELHFRLLYDPEKYNAELINRFIGHYQQLLKEIARNNQLKIRDYNLLPENEITEQLTFLNHSQWVKESQVPFIINEIEKCAKKNPDAIAVSMGGESLTYAELLKKSTILAANLQVLGIAPEERIGLAVKLGVETITGILGILKAGAVYVPLDLNYPMERIKYMIKDAGISYILTDETFNLDQSEAKVIELKNLFTETNEMNIQILPKQLAYIIYTSGSTGRPKGVMVTHENIYYSTMARKEVYEVRNSCKFLLLSSISFDSSMVGIFWTLAVGGEIILTEVSKWLDVTQLIEIMESQQVTHTLSVPSFVQLLLNQANKEQIRYLQSVIAGGEQFPQSLHSYQKEHFPSLTMFNEYGPTEGTVWASYYQLEDGRDSVVPIGFPTAHARIFIFDNSLNLVPKGAVGEIYIAGQGITRGYNNQPILTAERFIPNPFGNGDRLYRTGDLASYNEDGSIQFLGRMDGQVKVNGFRIEVAEIEAAIEAYQEVFKSVVLVKQENKKGARLVAYIVTSSKEFSLEELKMELTDKLPHYMVPQQFVVLPELPLTQNGKVDTKKLQEMKNEVSSKTFTAPRTSRENELTTIFQEVLGESVGIEDSFFEMGGDSILAIQISSRAMEKGWNLKPKDIFDKRTIANMAICMKKVKEQHVKREKAAGVVPLTPIQEWFFEQQFLYPNHWNQALRLKVCHSVTFNFFKQAMKCLVETHESLRLRFSKGETGWIQEYMNDNQSLDVTYIDFSKTQEQNKKVIEYAGNLQKSLDITKGPLISAAYFNMGNKLDNEVVIIAHHLVVDMVSWQILLQDLDVLMNQLLSGHELKLIHEATSYKEWSNSLSNVHQGILDKEKNYWIEQKSMKFNHLSHLEKGTEGTRKQLEGSLDAKETSGLLREVPKYYGTKVNETVLAAIALALKKFTQADDVLIDVESHGRKPFQEEIDLSRTVGWFTSVYPILLRDSHLISPDGDLLKYVKNIIREVPNEGIGYGIARWINKNPAMMFPDALFSYNYLGKIDQSFFQSEFFSFHSYLSETVKDSREKRIYLLEFEPYILRNKFCLRVNYSSVFTVEDIQGLIDNILDNIKALISFCSETEEVGFVASDFPEAKLDQESLEKFLSTLKHS